MLQWKKWIFLEKEKRQLACYMRKYNGWMHFITNQKAKADKYRGKKKVSHDFYACLCHILQNAS